LFLYKKGKSIVCPGVVTYYIKNRKSFNRYGITAGKKVGNAVLRNRARRIIRQAYLQAEHRMPKGYDFVFVARGRTPKMKTQDIFKNLIWQSYKIKDEKTNNKSN
jgi:ribonuclease P protein component